MVAKVDPQTCVTEPWNSDWYRCPECDFDSLNTVFNFCPCCGVDLDWDDVFEQ